MRRRVAVDVGLGELAVLLGVVATIGHGAKLVKVENPTIETAAFAARK